MKNAIYAGSFDPFTNGHEYIVNEGKKIFQEILIVVATNPNKKTFFSPSERFYFIQEKFKNDPQVRVISLENEYVAHLAQREGVTHLLRGIRNNEDMEYETNILRLNQRIMPSLQSVFLRPSEAVIDISSSAVKGLVGFPGWEAPVSKMVYPLVLESFCKRFYGEKLAPFWKSLMTPSEKWWTLILKKHSEEQRHYHNLNHLIELFLHSKELKLNCWEDQVLGFSILFHDIIYNPQSKTNEEDSAKLFLEFAQEVGLPEATSSRVKEFILATKTHENKNQDPLLDLFLDLDLSILGADPVRFTRYEEEIQKEYSFVPQEIYKVERAKVMKKFKDHPFKSEWAKNKWLIKAQENLKNY